MTCASDIVDIVTGIHSWTGEVKAVVSGQSVIGILTNTNV